MVYKSGRYGKFLACPNYPTCKSTLAVEVKGEEVLEGVCPDCGKPTKKLRSRTGKVYYGCSGYPECKFMSWDVPTGKKCPVCGGALVETQRGIRCTNKACGYREKTEKAEKPEKTAKTAKAKADD